MNELPFKNSSFLLFSICMLRVIYLLVIMGYVLDWSRLRGWTGILEIWEIHFSSHLKVRRYKSKNEIEFQEPGGEEQNIEKQEGVIKY